MSAQPASLACPIWQLVLPHFPIWQVPKNDVELHATDAERRVTISVRGAFVAPAGHMLVSADYRQLEMRLMAYFSTDPVLRGHLDAGGDLFRHLASTWHNRPLDAVSSVEREQAKQVSYGLCYGLGNDALGKSLGLSKEEANKLRDRERRG